MRHMKVRAELDGKYAVLTILERTHNNMEFGGYPEGVGLKRFSHAKVALVSELNPHCSYYAGAQVYETTRLHVRHTLHVGSGQGQQVRIPAYAWPAIKACIEKYNEVYAKEACDE